MALQGVSHQTTLTDIGDLFGFWCTCGRSTVGWRLRSEAEFAAEQHSLGNKAYGTCIYCATRGELTRFGWCVACHPMLAESKKCCESCGAYVKRASLSRRGICEDCQITQEKALDIARAI